MSRSPTSTIGFANGDNCTKDNKIWKRIFFFILIFGRRCKMLCLQCGFNFYYHELTYIVLFYLAIGFLGNSLTTCVNIHMQSDVKISLDWANKVQWNVKEYYHPTNGWVILKPDYVSSAGPRSGKFSHCFLLINSSS